MKKVIFSGLSGAIATTCIYPLACTKTRLQAEQGIQRTSPLSMMRLIWQEGGVKAFYRGWPPNVLFVMPEKAIKLTMNDVFKQQFRQWRGGRELGMAWEMAAGGCAGLCQVFATNPMELLQIQGATMTTKIKNGSPQQLPQHSPSHSCCATLTTCTLVLLFPSSHSSLLPPVRLCLCRELKEKISYPRLARELGLSGVYTGVFATLVRDIPFSMLYFSLYSEVKRSLVTDTTSASLLAVKSFASGVIAGTVAAAATCPFDVVKTRVHAAVTPSKLGLREWMGREVGQWTGHLQQIVKVEGYGALFRGIVPRCIIISPLFGITMLCFEEFQQLLG